MAKKLDKTYTNWGGARARAGRPGLAMDPVKKKYYRAYVQQKLHAGYRCIKWDFTFDEWLAWWGTDILQRGSRRGQLLMARKDPNGDYQWDNVIKFRIGQQ